jgi:hypothetical protein
MRLARAGGSARSYAALPTPDVTELVIPNRSFAVDCFIQTLRDGWPSPRHLLPFGGVTAVEQRLTFVAPAQMKPGLDAVDLGLDRLAIERWARHAGHAALRPHPTSRKASFGFRLFLMVLRR